MSTNRFGKELKEYNYTKEELAKFNYAKITTKNGEILIKLFNQEAPNTVANFVTLANEGFYDGLNFHRVIAGFMAQSGYRDWETDRKSTRLNSSHSGESRMPSSA